CIIIACLCRGLELRQTQEIHKGSHQQKNACDHQIRELHHVRLCSAVRLQLTGAHRCQLSLAVFNSGENESRADEWSGHGSNGIERLSKVKPPLRTFVGPQDGHVRIGAHLQERLAASHDEERKKKKSIDPRGSRRKKQERAGGADQQPNQESSAVADLLHEPSGRQCRKKIPAEERRLDEGRLKIIESQSLLQMWNQDVIQVDTQRPKEEQTGDQNKRHNVASLGDRN